ncbi:hypothetical protein FKR45_11975, partial [Neisseria meningitidis]|nr:hypothetical protein [Neisseria meningitidis]
MVFLWIQSFLINSHNLKSRHSRESGNLGRKSKETVLFGKFPCRRVWIPAFAGMTAVGFRF